MAKIDYKFNEAKLIEELKLYVLEQRKAGGTVNTAIVIVAATGIVQE